MLTYRQLRFLWCVLTCGVLFSSIPFVAIWIDQILGINNLNRWVHFLAYAVIAAIPVAAWRQRTSQILSLVFAMLGIAIGLLPAFQGALVHIHNAPAELFGVGAGILLGLNLRLMRNSAKSPNETEQNPSRLTMI